MRAVHEPDWYATHDVHLRTGLTVARIDRGSHGGELAGGERLGYDKLALATGSRPRTLPVPGSGLKGVHYLRTVGDSARRRAAIAAGGRVVTVAEMARWADKREWGTRTTRLTRSARETRVVPHVKLPA
jgi:3-phenylpropionate/trans-cinnamate dioxygenase ferredoxin reductase subunit